MSLMLPTEACQSRHRPRAWSSYATASAANTVMVDLTPGPRETDANSAAGRASLAAERSGRRCGGLVDRRVGPVAGTQNHVARAGAKYMYDVHHRLHRQQPQHHEPAFGARSARCCAITTWMHLKPAGFIDGRPRMRPPSWLKGPARSGRSTHGRWVMARRLVMPLDRWKAID